MSKGIDRLTKSERLRSQGALKDQKWMTEAMERIAVGRALVSHEEFVARGITILEAEVRSQGAGQWEAGRDAADEVLGKCRIYDDSMIDAREAHAAIRGLVSPPEGKV